MGVRHRYMRIHKNHICPYISLRALYFSQSVICATFAAIRLVIITAINVINDSMKGNSGFVTHPARRAC